MGTGSIIHLYVLATMDVQPTAPGYDAVMGYTNLVWNNFPNDPELSTLLHDTAQQSAIRCTVLAMPTD
ncbi:gp015 [Erwinia phage vB_EamP-S6]|uniref:Gp015 n=1 Tax=Erwinia phage vB_EamP-S6 TaxID=1051675 RepID=G0YQA7_9CAUD|nr:gp015 [Erwinia phage vB_EamP-S6]AEJ81534.1 gp015 [Erwinia phage vB_EamP-S6]